MAETGTVSADTVDVGVGQGSSGSFELDNVTLTSGAETIGDSGTGTFNQNGDTNTVSV